MPKSSPKEETAIMPPVGIAPMEFFSYERSKKMNGRKVRGISAITVLGMA